MASSTILGQEYNREFPATLTMTALDTLGVFVGSRPICALHEFAVHMQPVSYS